MRHVPRTLFEEEDGPAWAELHVIDPERGFNWRRTVTREELDALLAPLVDRTLEITQKLLKDQHKGWAHVDAVLTTGGSSCSTLGPHGCE